MGQVDATRDRRPLELIYYEAYLSEAEAKRREKYLKGGNGRAVLKVQISKTLEHLGYVCL
jgi:putative endonuclease